jgi:sialic acid synthase SpsE
MRQKFRRSIVANQIIKKGTKIISKMLSLKRPGTGLHPMYLNKIIGKIANKSFYKNEKLKL